MRKVSHLHRFCVKGKSNSRLVGRYVSHPEASSPCLLSNGHANATKRGLHFFFCMLSEGNSFSNSVIDWQQPSMGPFLPDKVLSVFDILKV